MGSVLRNLFHTMTWGDFRGQVPRGATMAALTASDIVFTRLESESRDDGTALKDNLTITITLHQSQSWAKRSERSAALLNHEQGHYTLTALTGRDLFIDLMRIKDRSFGRGGLQTELTRIRNLYNPQAIHNAYDSDRETNHGENAGPQRDWDRFIQRAFTEQRTPPMHAPDGAMYKVRLRDVLRTAGKI